VWKGKESSKEEKKIWNNFEENVDSAYEKKYYRERRGKGGEKRGGGIWGKGEVNIMEEREKKYLES